MVRGRLRSLVNIALAVGSGVVNVAARSCCLCMRVGSRNVATGLALAEDLGPNRPAPSSSASCSPIAVLKAPPAAAGSSPTAPSSAPSSFVARARPGSRPCRPATIKVDGGSVCAHLPGLPITPCFRVQKLELPELPRFGLRAGLCLLRFHQRNPRSELRAPSGRSSRRPAATPIAQYAPGAAAVAHRSNRSACHSRSSRNGVASAAKTPRPMVSIAAIMRPSRPSSRSASETMRIFGVAVGEARRSACAISSSSRCGLSAQTARRRLRSSG